MKRVLMKFTSLIICCLLLFASTVTLGGCRSSQEDLKEKCQVAFDYIGADESISGYSIEEIIICNQNVEYSYFDEGIAYRISLYIDEPTGIYVHEYFLGELNGETVLYYARRFQDTWNDTKVVLHLCTLTQEFQSDSK